MARNEGRGWVEAEGVVGRSVILSPTSPTRSVTPAQAGAQATHSTYKRSWIPPCLAAGSLIHNAAPYWRKWTNRVFPADRANQFATSLPHPDLHPLHRAPGRQVHNRDART